MSEKKVGKNDTMNNERQNRFGISEIEGNLSEIEGKKMLRIGADFANLINSVDL